MYLSEDEIQKISRNENDTQGFTELKIPAFDVHHKTIGNGNNKKYIYASTFEFRYHPDHYQLMKYLLVRCSEDPAKYVSFIPFGLSQITTMYKPIDDKLFYRTTSFYLKQ